MKKAVIFLILFVLAVPAVFGQAILDRSAQLFFSLMQNSYVMFFVSAVLVFVLLYGIFVAGLSRVPSLEKQRKIIALVLALLGMLGLVIAGSRFMRDAASLLAPFGFFGGVVVALAVFLFTYFFLKYDDFVKGQVAIFAAGMALIFWGMLTNSSSALAWGWFLVFVAIIWFLISALSGGGSDDSSSSQSSPAALRDWQQNAQDQRGPSSASSGAQQPSAVPPGARPPGISSQHDTVGYTGKYPGLSGPFGSSSQPGGSSGSGGRRPQGPMPAPTPRQRCPRDPLFDRNYTNYGLNPKSSLPKRRAKRLVKKQSIPDDQQIVIDLSKHFSGIRSQDSLGACTAFAASSIFEYILHVGYHMPKSYLSPLFLWYVTRQRFNEQHANIGPPCCTYIMETLAAHGVCFEHLWPFVDAGNPKWKQQPSPQAYEDAGEKKILGFYGLDKDDPDQWVHQLLRKNPINISMAWTQGLRNSYNRNFYDGSDPQIIGYHAVVIVGYHSHFPFNSQGVKAFKIRNSHDVDWGENGYIWIPAVLLKSLLFEDPLILSGWQKKQKKHKEHDKPDKPSGSPFKDIIRIKSTIAKALKESNLDTTKSLQWLEENEKAYLLGIMSMVLNNERFNSQYNDIFKKLAVKYAGQHLLHLHAQQSAVPIDHKCKTLLAAAGIIVEALEKKEVEGLDTFSPQCVVSVNNALHSLASMIMAEIKILKRLAQNE